MTVGIDIDDSNALIGRIISGKLRIIELLGSGSMGRVYRAHHIGLEKDVAIKVLRNSVASDSNRSYRFAREARAASRLNHPNSVAILDFGEDGEDRLLYIAMELLEGEDLQTVIDRGALRVERLCHIMIQALAALAAAHDAGIIHRDVKPSNIVLVKQKNDEGQITEVVKVCDFGVAKIYGAKSDTYGGSQGHQRVIGTPLYMSPEQAMGNELDPRSDVYSCGVLMYEMLTGQPPFSAETPMGVLMKHVSGRLAPPSVVVPNVAIELEALILWSLEKDRMLRPSSARELRNGLRAFLAGKAGTIPALARYGVQRLPDEDPWNGPTPYYQLDIPAPPRAKESAVLPAPRLPTQEEIFGKAKLRNDLVSDLNLLESSSILSNQPVSDIYLTSHTPRPESAPTANILTPPPMAVDSYDEESSDEDETITAGASKALSSSAKSTDRPRDASPASHIFSNQSYFETKRSLPSDETLDDEIQIDAPSPRAIRGHDDSGIVPPLASPKIQSNMLHYLWKRYRLAPDRKIPERGFWVRDSQDQELGPLTWSEVTHVLRMEAIEGEAQDTSVSADQQGWIAAQRFVRLTGTEAILKVNEPLPTRAQYQGTLRNRSVTSLFASVSHRSTTGRLIFRLDERGTQVRFEVHIDEGRPTYVFTNKPVLQLPNLLIDKHLVDESRLPIYIQTVLKTAITLEEAVRKDVQFDIAEYRGAVMKERLRHLLKWRDGRFAFDANRQPASHQPFAPSLLSLLPDLVYRTLSEAQLEQELSDLREAPIMQVNKVTERLKDMGLTRSQLGVAERLLAASKLEDVLPPSGQIRKAYTTMAYVLRETGLLQTTPRSS